MNKNESFQIFTRLIKQRHEELIDRLKELLRTLSAEDANRKKASAIQMLKAANDLKETLSKSDIPDWLSNSIVYLGYFSSGTYTAYDLLNGLINFKKSIENHRWVFDQNDEAAFDFDSIFEHYKKESRLPELFNNIIKILEEIEASGAIDSITMIRALGKLIATIKGSKDGSYFSINSTWEFLVSFMKNYMWAELAKTPVLGTTFEALKKTLEETNEEMFSLHKNIQKAVSQAVEVEIDSLKNKTEFPFISYDKNGRSFKKSGNNFITNLSA